MFFTTFVKDMTKNVITINSIQSLNKNIVINKNIKLMLIFSLQKCNPCKQLTSILDDLFKTASDNAISIPLQVIKFDYYLLSSDDKHLLNTFPTTIVIQSDQLLMINDNEPLIQYGINNGSVYVGQIQQLCDDHNLVSF